MSEKKRVTVDLDAECYYLDGEYWESWDNYGEEMADEINNLLNDQEDEIKRLKDELFETRKEYILDTCDISDKLYLDEMIEEERKEIYGGVDGKIS